MKDSVSCNVCGSSVETHASFIVRIDVYADPSVPDLSAEEIGNADFEKTLDALVEEMKHLSADDLQDGVHRRFEYRLCPACHKRFLGNPLGLPRKTGRAGTN